MTVGLQLDQRHTPEAQQGGWCPPWPLRSAPWACLPTRLVISPKQPVTPGSEDHGETAHSEQVLPSASALVTRALREPPGDRKTQNNIKQSTDITFDEIVHVAPQMRHQSRVGNPLEEFLGTAPSAGCNAGGRHPHDINGDAVECPAS